VALPNTPLPVLVNGKQGVFMSDNNNSIFNREAYNIWANRYDTDANSTIAVDDIWFPKQWQHITKLRVLEIGCGTGRHTEKLVRLGNFVTAIEPSTGMLEKAKTKLNGTSVEFIQSDFLTEETLASRKFDVILTSLVLEHIENVSLFFQRVAESLVPNGEFYLSEIHPCRIANGSQAKFIHPISSEQIMLRSFAHREDTILAAAKASGLEVATNLDILGDVELVKLNQNWSKHIGKPMIKILKFIN
jgi:2-polyprenyl-3-methyl-5-hydroxy-6-metoxy-1,4-benzoquinol methylase